MSEERSGSGAPIFRHEEAVEGGLSQGDERLIDAVDAHVTEHFGSPERVWHEIVSVYVHVDIHVVEPTAERPVYTLVTSGMSERPMTGPEGEYYAELMLLLPGDWPSIDDDAFGRPEAFWPYGLLTDLARLPHQYDTLLWTGHTVPNDDPPRPYARSTKLCGALVAPPVMAPEGFHTLEFDGREIAFHAVYPLHKDEIRLKLDEGADRLYGLMDEADITEMVEVDRPSVVPKRRGLFRRR